MSVGQELERLSGLKLFHNHMSIDLVTKYFDFGTPEGQKLVENIRFEFFKAFAASTQAGFIFTVMWCFDDPDDQVFIERITQIFEDNGAHVYWVELETSLEERLHRNRTQNRLNHKPSKRDIERSEKHLVKSHQQYRLNSHIGEIDRKNYLRIDNTKLSAAAVAEQVSRFIE